MSAPSATSHSPAISVVLPVHNAGKFLPLLLASLLNQTESDLEVLAVDDGSADNSLALLHEAARNDPRLKVFEQAQKGPSAARNYALGHARGRWIAFADSDDWLAPELLHTWLRRAEALQVDLLIGNGFHFRNNPQERPVLSVLHAQPWDEVISGEDWIIRCEKHEWRHQVWLQLIRHDFLLQSRVRFIDGILHEDIPWTLEIALAARRVGFLRTPLYGYRSNPESVTLDGAAAAIRLRVRSYLVILSRLASVAAGSAHKPRLRRALLHVAHLQSRRCISLLRKRLRAPVVRGELARAMLASTAPGLLFRGVRSPAEAWLAARGLFYLLTYAAIFRWHKLVRRP